MSVAGANKSKGWINTVSAFRTFLRHEKVGYAFFRSHFISPFPQQLDRHILNKKFSEKKIFAKGYTTNTTLFLNYYRFNCSYTKFLLIRSRLLSADMDL